MAELNIVFKKTFKFEIYYLFEKFISDQNLKLPMNHYLL